MTELLRDVWVKTPRGCDFPEFERRFWSQTERDGECLIWTGATTPYGRVSVMGKVHGVHRVAYWMVHGPLIEGLEVDHICNRPPCVEPSHLQQVERVVNWARSDGPSAMNARKTHCDHGHEFTPENTRITNRGGRYCRACDLERFHLTKGNRKPDPRVEVACEACGRVVSRKSLRAHERRCRKAMEADQ